MDWIERLIGIAPDGGNGALDALVVTAVLLLGAGGWLLRRTGAAGRVGRRP